jgi:hypothetical protein
MPPIAHNPKLRPRNAVLVASSIEVHCPYCDSAQPAPGGSEFCEPVEAKEMCDGSVRPCVSCDAQIRMIWSTKVQVI